TIYPTDTLVVPLVPPELTCPNIPPQLNTGCMTCDKVLDEAISFIGTYGGTPDTAYALPQLYANILNRNHGFNLPYYEFTRFLNSCDTIYNLLFGVRYKAIGEGLETMPVFATYLEQEVPQDYPGGIGSESEVGSCTCEKAYVVFMRWL